MSTNQPTNNAAPDWRELRRQEREQRRAEHRASRGNSGWIVGAVFILLGVLLIFQNMGAITLNNWWALFILIPAAASFGAAWNIFNNNGELSPAVIGPIVAGLVFVGLTVVFLLELNLNWSLVWPILLIVIGVSMLIGALAWRR